MSVFYGQQVRKQSAAIAADIDARIVTVISRRLGLHKGLVMVAVGVMCRQLGEHVFVEMGWTAGTADGFTDALACRHAGNRLVAKGMREVATDPRVRHLARTVALLGQSAATKILSATRWASR